MFLYLEASRHSEIGIFVYNLEKTQSYKEQNQRKSILKPSANNGKCYNMGSTSETVIHIP